MNRQLVFVCACILIVTPLPFVGIPHAIEFIIYEIIGIIFLYQSLKVPRSAPHNTSK